MSFHIVFVITQEMFDIAFDKAFSLITRSIWGIIRRKGIADMRCGLVAVLLVLSVLVCVSCSGPEPVAGADYDSVIIVGLDGAGHFMDKEPIFEKVFSDHSIVNYNCTAMFPTSSVENWGALLHGVEPDALHVSTLSLDTQRFPYPELPSIFQLAREAYPNADLASFCEWNPINYGLIEPSANVKKEPDLYDQGCPYGPEKVAMLTFRYLLAHDPKLMFVHLNGGDATGHAGGYGYGNPKYMSALSFDAGVISMIDQMTDDRTLLVVVADHGGTPEGTHGGPSPDESNVICAFKGRTINPDYELSSSFTLCDACAVVLQALGIEKPAFMTGNVPAGFFL